MPRRAKSRGERRATGGQGASSRDPASLSPPKHTRPRSAAARPSRAERAVPLAAVHTDGRPRRASSGQTPGEFPGTDGAYCLFALRLPHRLPALHSSTPTPTPGYYSDSMHAAPEAEPLGELHGGARGSPRGAAGWRGRRSRDPSAGQPSASASAHPCAHPRAQERARDIDGPRLAQVASPGACSVRRVCESRLFSTSSRHVLSRQGWTGRCCFTSAAAGASRWRRAALRYVNQRDLQTASSNLERDLDCCEDGVDRAELARPALTQPGLVLLAVGVAHRRVVQ